MEFTSLFFAVDLYCLLPVFEQELPVIMDHRDLCQRDARERGAEDCRGEDIYVAGQDKTGRRSQEIDVPSRA